MYIINSYKKTKTSMQHVSRSGKHFMLGLLADKQKQFFCLFTLEIGKTK